MLTYKQFLQKQAGGATGDWKVHTDKPSAASDYGTGRAIVRKHTNQRSIPMHALDPSAYDAFPGMLPGGVPQRPIMTPEQRVAYRKVEIPLGTSFDQEGFDKEYTSKPSTAFSAATHEGVRDELKAVGVDNIGTYDAAALAASTAIPFAHDAVLKRQYGQTQNELLQNLAEQYGYEQAARIAPLIQYGNAAGNMLGFMAAASAAGRAIPAMTGKAQYWRLYRNAKALGKTKEVATRAAQIGSRQAAETAANVTNKWLIPVAETAYVVKDTYDTATDELSKGYEAGKEEAALRAQLPQRDRLMPERLRAAADQELKSLVDNGELDPNNKEQMSAAKQEINRHNLMQLAYTGNVPVQVWESDAFKGLSPEQQKAFVVEYAMRRRINQQIGRNGKLGGTIELAGDWIQNKLHPGLPIKSLYEEDPEFRTQIKTLIMTGSPDLLVSLAADGGSAGGDSLFAGDMRSMIAKRFSEDPNFGARTLLLAQDRQSGNFKADPKMIQEVVSRLNSGGADKWMQGLSQENYLALGQMFLSNKEGVSALDSLGEEGKKFKDAMLSAARGAAFGQIMKDPTNLHQFAALWFQSKGWDTMAGIARDTPIAFYGGLAALVLGGGMLISSLFGGDDDDDEEQQQGQQMAYNPRLPQLNLADYS